MRNTPIVMIHSGANATLASYYEAIRADLDARYHQPGNSFPIYNMSDAEIAEIESLTSYANHASDGVEYDRGLYVDGVHIERLIT